MAAKATYPNVVNLIKQTLGQNNIQFVASTQDYGIKFSLSKKGWGFIAVENTTPAVGIVDGTTELSGMIAWHLIDACKNTFGMVDQPIWRNKGDE